MTCVTRIVCHLLVHATNIPSRLEINPSIMPKIDPTQQDLSRTRHDLGRRTRHDLGRRTRHDLGRILLQDPSTRSSPPPHLYLPHHFCLLFAHSYVADGKTPHTAQVYSMICFCISFTTHVLPDLSISGGQPPADMLYLLLKCCACAFPEFNVRAAKKNISRQHQRFERGVGC
jgi:hypothetical protein